MSQKRGLSGFRGGLTSTVQSLPVLSRRLQSTERIPELREWTPFIMDPYIPLTRGVCTYYPLQFHTPNPSTYSLRTGTQFRSLRLTGE